MQFKQWTTYLGMGLLTTTFAISSQAEIWSSTEVHYSNGDLLNPFSGKDESTSIITFQHAGGHKYGDNFFFVDHSRVKNSKTEFYGEWYSNFSLGTITGNDMSGYNHVTTATGSSEQKSSYMLDFNWAYPFKAGGFSWSIEGHAEYIAGRDVINSDGTKGAAKEAWILAQPQIRMDLGEALGNEAGNFYVGLELQYWQNKLGVKDQDESTVQLLTVWNF